MPTLDVHSSSVCTKLLLMGDSGTGKTGALVSLVLAGYKLYILDFDNGVDIIRNLLVTAGRPDLLQNVDVYTLTDPMMTSGSHLVPKEATAWTRMVKLLGEWPGVGPVQKLGEKDILVLDSMNFAGRAAMRFIAKLNNRLAVPPQIQDYFDAQRMIEGLCAQLYDEAVRCNVIVLTHMREISQTREQTNAKGNVIQMRVEGTEKMYPETGAGKAMSPVVGRFFNSVLLADIVGSGSATRRLIRTQPHGNIGLKNSAPGLVKSEYPLDTGLAQYFAAVRGETPVAGAKATDAGMAAIEAALPRR